MSKRGMIINIVFCIAFGAAIAALYLLNSVFMKMSSMIFFEVFLVIYLVLCVIWRMQTRKGNRYPGAIADKFFVYVLVMTGMLVRYMEKPSDRMVETVVVVGVGIVLSVINGVKLSRYIKETV